MSILSKSTILLSFEKMSSFDGPNMTQELLINIFSRLSVKSIGQLRCVSNPLNSLLSDKYFLKIYFNRHFQEPEKLILLSGSHTLQSITFNKSCVFSKSINFKPTPSDIFVEICGSCNGLVLILNEDDTKVVINPITLDFKKIPNSPLALDANDRYDTFSMHGFGYDFVNDDYKIVMISGYYPDSDDNEVERDMFMDIYSLKIGSWKRIKRPPYDHFVHHYSCGDYLRTNGVFVNGALHWLARKIPDDSSVICAFVLSDEEFVQVPAPSSLDKRESVCDTLWVLQGCLCLLQVFEGVYGVDVWMMKEYGVEGSWTKFSVDGLLSGWYLQPLCFMRDEEVVFNVDGSELTVYNLEEEELRDLEVDGIPDMFERVGTFVESLLSPNFTCEP